MITRFDQKKTWTIAHGEKISIKDMETSHIINTVGMLVKKPLLVQSMLIRDVEEKTPRNDNKIAWGTKPGNVANTSRFRITSMTLAETRAYVATTPLYIGMLEELCDRGVNVGMVVSNICEDEGINV